MCENNTMGISKHFNVAFRKLKGKGVSRKTEGCYKEGVSRKFQGRFESVSRKI